MYWVVTDERNLREDEIVDSLSSNVWLLFAPGLYIPPLSHTPHESASLLFSKLLFLALICHNTGFQTFGSYRFSRMRTKRLFYKHRFGLHAQNSELGSQDHFERRTTVI